MYTRTYSDEKRGILIPESYGGTALYDSVSSERKQDESPKSPWEQESNTVSDPPSTAASAEVREEETTQAFSFLSKLHLPAFITNIFGNGNFSLQKIGTEEILIVATAVFLFFSKEGDKECAIMLLLLLLIT